MNRFHSRQLLRKQRAKERRTSLEVGKLVQLNKNFLRYEDAFEKVHGRKCVSLSYKHGYVHVGERKVRVKNFLEIDLRDMEYLAHLKDYPNVESTLGLY